jgi:hypothetical protein
MLLEWSLREGDAALAVRDAVHETLEAGFRTVDVMPVGASDPSLRIVGTTAFTDAVVERVTERGRAHVGALGSRR